MLNVVSYGPVYDMEGADIQASSLPYFYTDITG